MNPEKRIEALEQELDVLKNQIQATLLDIREFLLTHTYHALRADELPPQTHLGGDSQGEEHGAAIKRVHIDDGTEMAEPANVASEAPADWEMLVELEEWTTRKLEQIGPEKTRDLILLYGEKGRFSPNVTDVLLEFVSLYRVDRQEKKRSTSKKKTRSPRPTEPTTPFLGPNDPYDSHDAPTIRSKNWPTDDLKAVADERRGHRQQPPAVKKVSLNDRSDREPPPDDAADDDGAQHSLILRLIAGVSNASVGMSRKGSRG